MANFLYDLLLGDALIYVKKASRKLNCHRARFLTIVFATKMFSSIRDRTFHKLQRASVFAHNTV